MLSKLLLGLKKAVFYLLLFSLSISLVPQNVAAQDGSQLLLPFVAGTESDVAETHGVEEVMASANRNCTTFTLTNQKSVWKDNILIFGKNATTNIEIKAPSGTTDLKLYYKFADLPMSQAKAKWTKIGEDNDYNPETKTFTASWQIPSMRGSKEIDAREIVATEIILAANVIVSGKRWTGNPLFKGRAPGFHTYDATCHKQIAIDDLYGVNNAKYDLQKYFNFKPGNYWEYEGINYSYSPGNSARNFKARIEVERPVTLCGHLTAPIRFMKNKESGYHAPVHNGVEHTRWRANFSNRWFATVFASDYSENSLGFEGDSKWNSNFIGSLGAIRYESLPNWNRGVGVHKSGTYNGIGEGMAAVYFSTATQHFYYPPYILGPRYLQDQSGSVNWHFIRHDHTERYLNNDISVQGSACNINGKSNDYDERNHGWEVRYDLIETWGDTSEKELRIRFIEYPLDSTTGISKKEAGILIEDWFLAKDIGLVRLKQQHIPELLRDDCDLCDDPTYNIPLPSVHNTNNKIIDMKAKVYYIGQKLQVDYKNELVPGQTHTPTFWYYQIKYEKKYRKNYTGYLELEYNGINSGIWTKLTEEGKREKIWVQDGVVTPPLTVSPDMSGKRTLRFRRWVPSPDSNIRAKDEKLIDYKNAVLWSDYIIVTYK